MTSILISSFAIIIFSALIHASFQLSVSVLTLISGHSLGRNTAHRRMLRLMNGFIGGVALLTTLVLTALVYYLDMVIDGRAQFETLIAAIICGLLIGLGVATWAFYYRKGNGTALWLPRVFAQYLTSRAKTTKNSAEAFSLGMASVIAEGVFIIAPMATAALAIISLPHPLWQVAGIGTYILTSLLSLYIVFMLAGGGHSISRIQAWREQHKRFLQFIGGGSLIILAAFLFVDRVIGLTMYGVFL